jgi:Ca2+-binding RTX toxin-like protein
MKKAVLIWMIIMPAAITGAGKRDANGGIVNGVVQEGFEDVIKDTDGVDEIHGLGGGDATDGMVVNDIIFSSDGSDLRAGGGGSDIIDGGAGDDFIWANNHLNMDNRVCPNERWAIPASGKKLIYTDPNWAYILITKAR